MMVDYRPAHHHHHYPSHQNVWKTGSWRVWLRKNFGGQSTIWCCWAYGRSGGCWYTGVGKPIIGHQNTLNIIRMIAIIIFTIVPLVCSLPNVINVGAVFTPDKWEQEIAFKLAIKRINDDQIILPNTRLVPKIERIQPYDSFHADKKVCGLLKAGVIAIFDPLDGHTSQHIQSICDALDIPHLETRWDFATKRDDLSVNLFPRPEVLARAYVDIVKAWGWDQFVIIYEDNEGLFRLQDFFKEAENLNWKIKLHQFKLGGPYRDTFWKIKNDGEKNIILDVKKENIYRALKHAQQVGLITESHSFLITQLDLHTIDLEDFKFGKTKITAFKIIDDGSKELQLLRDDWRRQFPTRFVREITTESALMYDAVKLMATATRDLDQSQSIKIEPVSCETSIPWSHGSSMINYMRPIEFRGITGLVSFNDQGFRSTITLSVVTVNPTGLEEIGTWSEDAQINKRLNISQYWNRHYASSVLDNKTLIITTVLSDPYTMIKESSFKRMGNDRFEGYAIDLITELSKLLNFKYEFRLVKDGAYGRPDKNGSWNGMIGELMRGEADLAVADLTITSKRENAADFTHPFMNTGISILYKKPTKKVTSLFSFLSPFSNVVWIYVLCAYIGVSTMLFIVGRLSPYEWENPHPCRGNEQVLENSFSLSNSFWFTIGSLMQQASDLTPKAMSTRTIAGIWYFFTLIMIASYTANLAAFLTVEKIVYPIENAEGLAAQETIKYGCLTSGSTASFFAESNITTYRKMWDFMSKHQKEVFMTSNVEGRRMVEKSEGMYAYLMESASIEYTVERSCNLTQIGGLLDSKGYGVATRKDSPYRTPLSEAILKLQESGELLTLKERWWKHKKGGGKCIDDPKKSSGSVTPLKIDNVGGVFVVLLGGLSFSLFVVILEFVWRSRYENTTETICEEMMNDLKFAMKCQSSSKLVRNKLSRSASDSPLNDCREMILSSAPSSYRYYPDCEPPPPPPTTHRNHSSQGPAMKANANPVLLGGGGGSGGCQYHHGTGLPQTSSTPGEEKKLMFSGNAPEMMRLRQAIDVQARNNNTTATTRMMPQYRLNVKNAQLLLCRTDKNVLNAGQGLKGHKQQQQQPPPPSSSSPPPPPSASSSIHHHHHSYQKPFEDGSLLMTIGTMSPISTVTTTNNKKTSHNSFNQITQTNRDHQIEQQQQQSWRQSTRSIASSSGYNHPQNFQHHSLHHHHSTKSLTRPRSGLNLPQQSLVVDDEGCSRMTVATNLAQFSTSCSDLRSQENMDYDLNQQTANKQRSSQHHLHHHQQQIYQDPQQQQQQQQQPKQSNKNHLNHVLIGGVTDVKRYSQVFFNTQQQQQPVLIEHGT